MKIITLWQIINMEICQNKVVFLNVKNNEVEKPHRGIQSIIKYSV